jgi:hypothetical protein
MPPLNLSITENTRAQIEHLADVTDASHLSEVVRRSVELYVSILRVMSDGSTLMVYRPDGTSSELLVAGMVK